MTKDVMVFYTIVINLPLPSSFTLLKIDNEYELSFEWFLQGSMFCNPPVPNFATYTNLVRPTWFRNIAFFST